MRLDTAAARLDLWVIVSLGAVGVVFVLLFRLLWFRVCLRFGGVVKFAFGVVFICWLGCWFTVIWWLLVAGWFWTCSLLMLFTG